MNPNWMILRIQPDEGIALEFAAKRPGPTVKLSTVSMDFAYKTYFKMAPNTGYETLIYDCMIGDATLFQRADNVEAGWQAVQPILDAWANNPPQDFPIISRAATARRRPTNCWRATDARGGRWIERRAEVSMTQKRKISLVLADVDGTLVTEDKVLTQRAQAPSSALQRSRHPLRHHQRPAAAGHGDAVRCARARYADRRLQRRALRQARSLDPRSRRQCPPMSRAQAIELIREHGLDAWVYRGNDWLITKAGRAACRARGLDGQVRAEGRAGLPRHVAAKWPRSSASATTTTRCSAAKPTRRPRSDSARRRPDRSPITSTSPTRTRTRARWWSISSRHIEVPAEEIATIGDQPNDVLMFKRSGFSIAMGNASDRSRRRPAPSRIPTMTRASPRRWSDSSSVSARLTHERDDWTHRDTARPAGARASTWRNG